MKKAFFTIVLLFFTHSVQGSFRVGDSVSYAKEIADHAQALEQFKPFHDLISWKIWSYSDSTTTQKRYNSIRVKEEAAKYWEIHGQLTDKILANAVGNGFIIGFCGALLNRLLESNGTDWRALTGTLISSAALIVYQNQMNEKIPCVGSITTNDIPRDLFGRDALPWKPTSSGRYEIKESVLSELSGGRFISCSASALTSFYLTKWALDYLLNKKKPEAQEENTLNQLVDEKKQ